MSTAIGPQTGVAKPAASARAARPPPPSVDAQPSTAGVEGTSSVTDSPLLWPHLGRGRPKLLLSMLQAPLRIRQPQLGGAEVGRQGLGQRWVRRRDGRAKHKVKLIKL